MTNFGPLQALLTGILFFFITVGVFRWNSRLSLVIAVSVPAALAIWDAHLSVTTGMGLPEHALCNVRPSTPGCGGERRVLPLTPKQVATRRLRAYLDGLTVQDWTNGDIASKVIRASDISSPEVMVELADDGDGRAAELVGAGYDRGIAGFEIDKALAGRYFVRAVDSGSISAPGWAADHFETNPRYLLQSSNNDDVVELLRLGAMRGDPWALIRLGEVYLEGRHGIARNPFHAAQYFEAAARRGNGMGLYFMGRATCEGRGVFRDVAAANAYFRRAMALGVRVDWAPTTCPAS